METNNNETSFTFRLFDDGTNQKKYLDFLRVLALQRYQFRVTTKHFQGSIKMMGYVKNYKESW